MSNTPFGKRPRINPSPNVAWGEDPGRPAKEAVVIPTQRPLAGARQNNRGGSYVFPSGAISPSTGQTITLSPTIVESPRGGGDDAELMTITLGISSNTSLYGNVIVRVTAVIEWGVGGAVFQTEVDWVNGVTLSVVASTLKVKGKVTTIAGGVALSVPEITLAASFGYGGEAGDGNGARFSVFEDTLLAAGVTTISVPSYATSVTFLSSGRSTSPLLTVEMPFSAVFGYPYKQTITGVEVGSGVNGAIAIPNGVWQMTVTNDGDATESIAAVFNLSL